MWEENEYLKVEIEKLGDEIDRKRNKAKMMRKTENYSVICMKKE